MIRYRAFLNRDPPLLAYIWRSCSDRRGLAQPMSAAMLEDLVLSKPFFDRDGLILALDDERPIGFVHAGFGPTEDEARLSTELGVTVILLTVPHPEADAVAAQLLALSEAYLRERGAKVLYGGGIRPLNPFYVGLYGGSELPGILDSDPQMQAVFRAHGYREIDRTLVFHRELGGFRPIVDRLQMQIRRSKKVECDNDPPPGTWWDACTMGPFDRTLFRLTAHQGGPALGTALFRTLEPFSATWGVRAAGLIDVRIEPSEQHKGLATYLIGESLRQLHESTVSLVEVQTMQRNQAAIALYKKLGFQQVDTGAVFRKE